MPIITVPIINRQQWLDLRKPNIGCSEVGALFGVHDYLTAFTLAARKLGKLDDELDDAVLKRGRLLEPVAATLLGEQHPDWTLIPAHAYYYDPDVRFGATPDLFVKDEAGRTGLIQIKTVAPSVFASKWRGADAKVEPPLWIALQAMCEQHLTGADFAAVAALVVGYGIELEVIDIPRIPHVIEMARSKVEAFWQLVDRGELPAPDYGQDRQAIARVFAQDDGTELDLTGDNQLPAVVDLLEAAKLAKQTAQDSIDQAQAQILHRLGSAQRARFSGGIITAKTINRKEYTVAPSSYRRLTVKQEGAVHRLAVSP